MNRTSMTLFLLAAACLLLSVLPWPVGETQDSPVAITTTQSDVLDGKTLFVAKGCVTCHNHAAFDRTTMNIFWGEAPNLTNYQGTAEFLRLWLKDPRSVRADAGMPNLNLSDAEIEALITFLQEPHEE